MQFLYFLSNSLNNTDILLVCCDVYSEIPIHLPTFNLKIGYGYGTIYIYIYILFFSTDSTFNSESKQSED